MAHQIEAIIFDFDYTLADSSRGIIRCIDHALRALDLPAVSAETARRTIGLSLPDTFRELAGQRHMARAEEFARLFIQYADRIMADLTVILEPVPRTIARLAGQGVAMGIVSTKYRYRIETVLRREGLLEPFALIVGGEDVSRHKPDPEGLLKATAGLGCSPASCLYVGDSLTDAETAKRAGVPFVAVLSGVTLRVAFKGYTLYGMLEDLSGLPALITD